MTDIHKNYGFVKVAAATVDIKVADVTFNACKIKEEMKRLAQAGVKLAVFPELCLTGYTCSDLFWQQTMLRKVTEALVDLASFSEGQDMVTLVGLPMEFEGKLYNVAAVLFAGRILGIIPKIHLPNYSEFYEARHFTSGQDVDGVIEIDGKEVPFAANLLFQAQNLDGFALAVEICEDLWVPNPPSTSYAMAGATVIANLSASDEVTGKDAYRRTLVSSQSARLICGYIYADAGEGESTTDLVFAGHNLIMENGQLLSETRRFTNEVAVADLDLDRLVNERRKMTTYQREKEEYMQVIPFSFQSTENHFERYVDPAPFVPSSKADRDRRCEEILSLQAMGLKKRISHTHAQSLVIGVSGGLDSTLAMLVTARALDSLSLPRTNLLAVTMPGFGTTDRTYQNAVKLIEILGATFKEISIADAVTKHFSDIGHDASVHDVTYENSQARQRTYLLMDLANQYNGMVVGTGDMSELALGWATYNGDHMSMYGVNASVPKTLVRHLVRYYADTCGDEDLQHILLDVLDTPVSPELLPPQDGAISQKTEDLVGPYELHDFFLYYVLRLGYEPKKILFLAKQAFAGQYEEETIRKWLYTFYRRFFAQQFKRSCLPDGPKVGSVAVSPRGDLRMPSDAVGSMWLAELE